MSSLGRTAILDLLASIGFASFLPGLADWWHGDRGFLVLNYHRVGDRRDPFFPGLSRRSLAAQMLHLSEHWNVLPLSELVERSESGDLPPRAMGITFDDNYADFHEIAWPLLRGLGLPATLFVPTGPLVNRLPLWYDRCAHALKTTDRSRLPELGLEGLDGVSLPEPPAERAGLGRILIHRLKYLDEERRRSAVRRLEEELAPAPYDAEPALAHGGIDDLRRAARQGADIGSHSVSHPVFSRLSISRTRVELRDSKATLESWLDRPIELFAYPNGQVGDYTEETVRELAEAGYRCAFTTTYGFNRRIRCRYTLQRSNGWHSSGSRFGLFLAYAWWHGRRHRPPIPEAVPERVDADAATIPGGVAPAVQMR